MHLKPINCRGPFFAITGCILLAGGKNVNEYGMLEAMKERENGRERFEVEKARGYFQREGIEMVLFDMDSTLVKTTEGFRESINEFCQWVKEESGSEDEAEEIQRKFLEIYGPLRAEFGVYPVISEVIAENVRRQYGLAEDERYEQAVKELMEIYRSPFEICGGAKEMVEVVFGSGVRTGVVTIADDEWTKIKMREYFFGKFEGQYCIDTMGKKDVAAWKKGLERFGVEAEKVMVVGDSWWGDIVPALELGVKKVVWINEKGEDHKDERVIEIRGIKELSKVWLDGATPGNRTQDLLFTKQPL